MQVPCACTVGKQCYRPDCQGKKQPTTLSPEKTPTSGEPEAGAEPTQQKRREKTETRERNRTRAKEMTDQVRVVQVQVVMEK